LVVDLAAIMDALAGAVPAAVTPRVYAHPVGSVVPPAAVVGYPSALEYDSVFARGADRVVLPVWFVCGAVDDAGARTAVAAVISGTNELKLAIETNATLATKVDTARVTDAAIESMVIGGVEMIAVRFDVEVYA
jgi:hypothetical protein